MYKTYSYCYSIKEIEKYLKREGYRVQSLASVFKLSFPLKGRIRELLMSDRNLKENNPSPSCFYTIKLAWKNDEELQELLVDLEDFALNWKKKRDSQYGGNSWFTDRDLYTYNFTNCLGKYTIQRIFGNILQEQINKVIPIR